MRNVFFATCGIVAAAAVMYAAVAVSGCMTPVESPTMPGGRELLLRHHRGAVASLEVERARLADLKAGKWGATEGHVRAQEGVVRDHEEALDAIRADCLFRFGCTPEELAARLTP